jgi:hypothetical protein
MMRTDMTKDTACCTDGPTVTERWHGQTTLSRVRLWVVTPRGLTISGVAVVALGLVLNWSWFVAVGAAPLILSLAPCAAMCALGLCMNMRGDPKLPMQKSDTVRSIGTPEASPTGLVSREP